MNYTSQVERAAQAFILQDLYVEERREGIDLYYR